MTKESLWYTEILLAITLVHDFSLPSQRYIGDTFLPSTLVHLFCLFQQIGTIVAIIPAQWYMIFVIYCAWLFLCSLPASILRNNIFER